MQNHKQSPVDDSFDKLIKICDTRPETIDLTLDDCQNLYLILIGLRTDLIAKTETLSFYEKFHKTIVKAVKKLEDSGE